MRLILALAILFVWCGVAEAIYNPNWRVEYQKELDQWNQKRVLIDNILNLILEKAKIMEELEKEVKSEDKSETTDTNTDTTDSGITDNNENPETAPIGE